MGTANLAARNLLRSRRRTLLTSIALIAGVGIYIFGEGFVSGTTENLKVSAIDGTIGHLTAQPAGYPTLPGQYPVDELLALTPEARALLDGEAQAWTERTYFGPLLAHGMDSLRVMAIGFDPARDEAVFPRKLWRVDGAMPDPAGGELAVSTRVASLLGLKVGDRVILQVRTHQGALNALEATVSGVVATGNMALDSSAVFVPRALTRELLAAQAPTHVSVRLEDRDDSTAFAQRLEAALGAQAKVITWQEDTRELVELQTTRQKALKLVMFVLMALAALGVANTILMAAYERIREVGTLRSLGMTEGGILRLFLFEGALLGIFASGLGALWGGALVAHYAETPMDLTKMMAQQGAATANLSVSGLIYTAFDPRVIAGAMVVGTVVAILASIYPARVASRMPPAEAVRA